MRMWAVLNSVKDTAFNEHYLPPFTVLWIWWSIYHIAYVMYTFSARVSLVYSYNRNTRCSEARPLTTDGLATHLACCAVQRQCSVSSCCSRPV